MRIVQGLCNRKENSNFINDDEYYKQLSLENKILDYLFCFMKEVLLESYILSFGKIKNINLKENIEKIYYYIQ